MGKLIISTHITVDGVIGPDPGEWGIFEGESERFKYDQLLAADAFVLAPLPLSRTAIDAPSGSAR